MIALALFLLGGSTLFAAGAAAGPCDAPLNEIVCENSKAGNPASEWDVSGSGDSSIQGFTTDISVDQGQTVFFKVSTPSTDYRLDIYRMGYYDGKGARKVTTVQPSASLPQSQPACKTEASTGLVDCGNWSVSASWAVPASAVSGIYFAKLQREDQASGGSHVLFIVRDDDGHSDVLFQTADTTWQAYNRYGGNSLYVGGPGVNPARAYKVSYNRPLTVRGQVPEDSPFNAEYPMIRWLERNGYDVSYTTGVDSERRGAEMLEHEAFLSVGHDEYWSGGQRENVEDARDAGVNLAFFSGNEVFWKTRWENSIDGSGTSHRTLVSYKETHANANLDPSPAWTGTWRDPRFSPPADGGRPENQLTGTSFAANAGDATLEVSAADGKLRLWRNTGVASLAPGQTATLTEDTLGYEWDEAPENGFQPPGLVRLSSTTANVAQKLLDYGNSYGPGEVTHNLTLYRAASGALVFGAGTIQWSWGLDGEHDRGDPEPSVSMQQATANLLADMGAQPGSQQEGLVSAVQTTDTQPPSANIASLSQGADVEASQPLTISGTASDIQGETGVGGRVGAVEVSVDGGKTWHQASGRANWSYTWTPSKTGAATIMARAVDDSGNLESPGDQVGIDVVAQTCPCSLWENALTANQDPDQNPIEVGVKFRSDVAGFITGLRFYKTAGNTGTHIGRIWTTGGTSLGQVTFAGETPTGWQHAKFDTPVAISANTTYIASYHAPAGRYASIGAYFKLVGFDNPPLHAPVDGGIGGSNGIYKYGAAGGLFTGGPPNTFNSENYIVDVVFDDQLRPDTSSPVVTFRSPAEDSVDLSADVIVNATFDEAINPATISGSTVKLRDPSGEAVSAVVTYSAAQRQLTLDPDSPLLLGTTYTATLKGGAGGIADLAGNPLAGNESWSFITVAPPPPPPDEGPGGPILVVSNGSNPFSRYYTEILRAEGLNQFTATDVTKVTAGVLASRDVVILGEGPLSPEQAQMFNNWVQQGGNLIAMRPDGDLAGLLGLTKAGGTLGNAYLQVNTGSGPGAGIVGQTIQFHGTADRYSLNGAQTIATLYSSAATSTANPAVTLHSVGSNGGEAAAFTYDLARSVVLTRQGNPAWIGQDRDGQAPIRSDDLFFGAAAGDPQPDWVDLNKVAIPQADEQQRLLTNLIGEMNLDRKPLPRFWFLPRDEKAVVVMTGDDHGNGGTKARFKQHKAISEPGCVVADWECVRSTSYIFPSTPITAQESVAFNADGFEIGLHPQTNCKNWTSKANLQSVFSTQLSQLAEAHPGIPAPTTNRMHCIVWSDWLSQPEVELENGIRLDTSYYYWPEAWVKNRPGMFTGSGMPMRFAKTDGTMVDVYQAATQMTDESGQAFPFTSDQLLDKALGPEGYYGAFVANMHTDKDILPESDAIIASAQARDVPVITSRQLLTWLDGRNQSSFGSIQWVGNELSFTINHAPGANGLRAMVPTASASGTLDAIDKGGVPVVTTTETIKGVEYAFFDAAPGSYTATYADESLPLISNIQVAAGGDGTATVSWDTDEPASSRVDYGTNPSALTSNVSNPALVTSHSVKLSGLDPDSTYHYRVTSADGEAHAATKPNPALAPQSFGTPPPAPQLSVTVPPSPANQNSPKVSGSASAGTTVRLYVGANCASAPIATVTAAELASGVTISVADNSTTSIRATATSAAGASACSAPLAYVEDSAAPNTQITAQPPALANSATATFSFTGDDTGGSGVASFQCRIDSEAPGAWAACISGQQFAGLSEGVHKLEVRALDQAGNADATPAVYGWTVDTKGPNTQITANPAALVNVATASFSFAGDDTGGSGIASFQCRLDSEAPGAWEACTSAKQYSGLGAGTHKFEVRAIDNAGNPDATPASHSWQIDLTAPLVTIDPLAKSLLKAGESTQLNWHANENGTFQLRVGGADCDTGSVIDSGSYGTSPAAKLSNVAAAQLQEGANTLRLCLTDAAGNRAAATTTVNKDTQAPDTSITAKPAALVNVATASFSFTGDDTSGSGIASFQCRIDSEAPGAWETCTSAKQYASLSEGSHKFEVRTIDNAGNADATPASHTWSVDTKAPDTVIDSGPSAVSSSAVANFVFHGDDQGGSGGITLQCRRDSSDEGDWQPCTSPLKSTSLAEGPHSFDVRATDAAGNTDGTPVSFNWTVDTKAPDTSITAKPAALVNVATASFSFTGDDTDGSGVTSFQCRLDSEAPGAWEACTSAKQHSGLSDGNHKFEVRAIDQAGNLDGSPASHSWTVDTKAPDTSITAKPAALVNVATASFSFNGDDTGGSGVASFQCRIDSEAPGAWEACTSAQQYSGLSEDSHKFEVRVVDQAGNLDATPASYIWTVDTKAPDTSITAKPAVLVNVATASFSFTGEDTGGSGVTSFQCRLDSEAPGAWETCTSAKQYSGLSAGSHKFEVRAIDNAGNADATPASHTWQIDLTPPVVSVNSGPAGLTNNATPTFGFGSEPGATFECSIDTGTASFGACSAADSHTPAAPLSDGPHTFRVRATDQAGNQAVATRGFTVDATQPNTQITANPAGLVNVSTASFSFTGDDTAGSGVASFQCRIDSEAPGAWEACTSAKQYSGLAEGVHKFEVRVIDSAGNADATPASYSWSVDAKAPETVIDSGPPAISASATANFVFHGDDQGGSGGITLQCRRDSSAQEDWEPCGSPRKLNLLAEGAHVFEVRAADQAGNIDATPATHSWTIDTKAPDTSITAKPAALVNIATASFSFTGDDTAGSGVASFQCRIDSEAPGAWEACTSAKQYVSLSEGSHKFEVRALDQAGNPDATPATHTWQIDLTPPVVSVNSGPIGLTNNGTPTFGFGSEPGATFECSIDTGTASFGACTAGGSHAPAAPLADGSHTFRVRATDQAGNQAVATRGFTLDATQPNTQITANPAALINVATASFSFNGDDTGGSGIASFQCRIDSEAPGAWEACTSAKQYSGLSEGSHKFDVRAIDNAGNPDATPASYAWNVDTKAPDTSITAKPAALVNVATASFSFTGDDTGGSGVASFQCRIDSEASEAWGTCTSAKQYSGLSDGSHKFEVRAIDQAGNPDVNPATHAWTVDTKAPDTQITAKPAALVNVATASFSFAGDDTSGSGVASFQCRIDSEAPGAWEACTSAKQYSGLGEGSHKFEARSIDNAGNTDATPASHTWQIDLTAPTVSVNSGPAGLTNNHTPTFGFGSEPGVSFECSIDTGTPSFGPCSAASSHTPAAPLADGSHTFRVRATDQAGNQAVATRGFTLDATQPNTQITANPAALVNVATASFSFTGDDTGGSGVASFQCRLDSEAPGAWETCISAKQYSGLSEGSHKFEVRAIDNAGNADATPAFYSWSVDTKAPDTSITAKPAALVNIVTASFSFNGDDTGGSGVTSFQCRIDSEAPGAWEVCASAKQYSDLSEGAHKFEVRAIDQAGNADASPATHTWTVDTKAPDTQITANPAALANLATASFSFAGDDPGGSGVASFQCRLDSSASEAWETCTSAKQYSGLSEGAHKVEVRSTDAAGNTDSTPVSFNWTVDTKAPDTSITAKPAALVNVATASFSFTGDDAGGSGVASFQCRIDSEAPAAWEVCTSAKQYVSLSEGSHKFEVRALDQAGNPDATPASHTWQIDLTPPAVSVNSGPAGLTNNNTPTFGFVSEPGATFECSIDTGTASFGSCSAGGSHAPAAPLADGPHTFRVRATDQAGNQAVATRSFQVDTAAPQAPELSATVPPSPANANAPKVIGSAPAGTTIRLYEDVNCAGAPIATVPVGELETGVEITVADNSTTSFSATATTPAENVSGCSEALTYVEDSAAPNAQITASPPALVNVATASFSFTGDDTGGSGVASFQCRIDSEAPGAWEACTSAKQYSSLSEGSHKFEVRAIDNAGNADATPASHNWQIDLTAPVVSVNSGPAGLTSNASPTFGFGSEPGATFECSIDTGTPSFGPCSAASSHTPAAPLADGSHTFRVRATDQAGNQAVATRGFTLDATQPNTQITANPAALINVATASFSFNGDDTGGSGIASFQCRIDSEAPGAWEACTSAKQYSGLSEGSHKFDVRAIDNAGNPDATPASYAWNVDTKAPDTSITAKPAALVNVATASFSFTGDDTGGSGVTSFQCRIDSEAPEAWGTCTSAKQYSGLSDGSHKFEVRAIDQASNLDASPATYAWTVDTKAPDTSITAKPAALVNVATASFSFTGDDTGGSGVASFQCRLDSNAPEAWEICTSAKQYSNLSEGSHKFEVRALDQAGNPDATPATHTWQIDLTPPAVSVNSGPAGLTNNHTPTFGFGSEPSATFECSIDTGTASFGPCSAADSHTPAAPLSDGPHTFRVRAIDQAGNQAVATRSFQVDTAAPQAPELSTTVPPSPANANAPKVVGFALAGTTVRLYLGADCSGAPLATVAAGELEDGVAVSVADNSTTSFSATATTSAENVSGCSEPLTYIEDSAAPDTQINASPSALINVAVASFSFAGEDPGGSGVASFQCRMDSSAPEAWEPCTSAKQYAGLEEGVHKFEVRAADAAGNTDSTPASFSWSVDTKAPDTSITDKPAALVNVATASFSFNGSDGGSGLASFQCRLDSNAPEAWEACTSARQYSGLSEGSHKFEVRALDQAGNPDATPASHTWQIDLTPPAVSVNSGPAGLTNNHTPTFGFGSEPGATFECSIDTGTASFGPCSAAGSHTPAAPLAEGPHTFRVRATDQAGNQAVATRDFQVDTAVPATPELTATTPGSPASANALKVIGSAPAGTTIRLYQGANCAGTPIATVPVSELEAGIEVTVADNSTTSFRATATTSAENASGCSEPLTYVEDSAAPSTQITANPAALVSVATASFSFNGDDTGGSGVASFQCRLDSNAPEAWEACTSTEQYTDLGEGSHKFETRAIDNAGNADATPATHTWQIDLTAPTVSVDSGPTGLTSDSTPTFGFGSEPSATFECSIDTGTPSFGPCSAAGTHTPAAPLSDGAHAFRVRAIDQAGNQAVATRSFAVDAAEPTTQITESPAALVNAATASFSFTADDTGGSGVASLQCRLDSNAPEAWETCTSAKQYSDLSDGAHKFEVRALDQAGNADGTPASRAWSVDTKAPETSITANPATLVNVSSTSFSFAGEDLGGSGVASFECRRDSDEPDDWAPCVNPRKETSLAEGSHRFEVRATDQAGNVDSTPASFEWTIDTKAPQTEIIANPPALANSTTASFSFDGDDADGSGVTSFECRRDSGPWQLCSSPRAYTGLAVGPHSFEARAIDAAGNSDGTPATYEWEIDSNVPAAPQLTATTPASPANDNNPLVFGSASPGTTVRLYNDADCSGTPIVTDSAAGLVAGVEVTVADDSTTAFRATATTAADNTSGCSEPLTYIEDSSAPQTQITANPAALVNLTTATFSFAGEDLAGSGVAALQCRLDSSAADAWEACTSAKQYSGLTAGSHKFEVRAIDNAGNADATPASHAWQVDLTVPTVSLSSGPAGLTNDSTPTFSFGSEPGATFECSIDAGAPSFGSCSAASSHTPAAPLSDGPHTFRVRATDQAGNQTVATRSFTLDATDPNTQITAKPTTIVKVRTASFSFDGDDPSGSGVVSFQCRLDSTEPTAWQSCTSPQGYADLADGPHGFEVRAVDTAGNADESPAAFQWTVDTSVTQPPVDSGSAAPSLAITEVTGGPARFLRIRRDAKEGAARLVFEVPGPGQLSIHAEVPETHLLGTKSNARTTARIRQLREQQRSVKPRSVQIDEAGQVEIPLELTRIGKRVLQRDRMVRVKVVIRFKSAEGSATTWKIAVTLRKDDPSLAKRQRGAE
jgi:hypothetical protein